jgi:parvulin-like peptidyl-prolyl isomerase
MKKKSFRNKKPKLPAAVKRSFKRTKAPEERMNEALSNVPRITNETVTEHREEVLSSARKYIYPLQHSKHRIVRLSLMLFICVIVAFLAYFGLSLYKFQSTSGFTYGVTRVVPLPVAKAGPSWVSYESYLFELRRNMHYYHTQQHDDFSTEGGKARLQRLKQQAMAQVIQDAYVKQLAQDNGVTVSQRDVDNQVALLRAQNRLGSSEKVFRDVLNEFWGWSVADFKRELKQEMLQQAVVGKLDTGTRDRAVAGLKQLQSGTDFAMVATQLSDDPATKGSGGNFGAPITSNDRNLPPVITDELFKMKPGQISGIINAGYSLQILKVNEVSPSNVQAAHIQFTFKPVTDYTQPLQAKKTAHQFIRF